MDILIEPVIREEKVNKKGLAPVYLRFTRKGKRLYHSLGMRIPPAKWLPGHYIEVGGKSEWVHGQVAPSFPNSDLLNAKIANEKGKLERELLNLDIQGGKVSLLTVDSLLQIDSGSKGDFYKYAKDVVMVELAKLVEKKEYSPNTYRLKEIQYKKLKEYAPTLIFADITPVFLTKYFKHLTIQQKAAITSNSSLEAFKFIRQVFVQATESGITNYYPFKDWTFPQYKRPDKIYLTLDECARIEKLLFDDIPEEVKKVAAFFLLECFSGIRVSDWNNYDLEKLVKDNTMKLKTTKTGARVTLPLDRMPSLKRIVGFIKDNDLRYHESGQHANRILKIIATSAKISKHLTTHVGRHTFATQNLSIGVSKEAIASALGVSLKVVNTYAQIVPDKLNNELKRIGSGV
jgi:site-specific recombinase XerD